MAAILPLVICLVAICLPISSSFHPVGRQHLEQPDHPSLWFDTDDQPHHRPQRQQVAPDGPLGDSLSIDEEEEATATSPGAGLSGRPLFLQSALVDSAKGEPTDLWRILGSIASKDKDDNTGGDEDNMLGSKVGDGDVSDFLASVWEPRRKGLSRSLSFDSNLINNIVDDNRQSSSDSQPDDHSDVDSGLSLRSPSRSNIVLPAHATPASLTGTIPRPTESSRERLDHVTRTPGEADQLKSITNEQARQVLLDLLYNLMLREIQQKMHINQNPNEVKQNFDDELLRLLAGFLDKHVPSRSIPEQVEKLAVNLDHNPVPEPPTISHSPSGTNSLLFQPRDRIQLPNSRQPENSRPNRPFKRDHKTQALGTEFEFLDPLLAADLMFRNEHTDQPSDTVTKPMMKQKPVRVSEPESADDQMPAGNRIAREPILMQSLIESLKLEPQRPQLMLPERGFTRDNDVDDVLEPESSASHVGSPDDEDMEKQGIASNSVQGRSRQAKDRAFVSWLKDLERWQPIPESPAAVAAGQSSPTYLVADDEESEGRDGGVVDEEKVHEWISAADILPDDQDYDLQFPALKFLLSEKRVDVRKPGPHFDRMIGEEDKSPSAILLSKQHADLIDIPDLRFLTLTQDEDNRNQDSVGLLPPASEKRVDVKKPGPLFDRGSPSHEADDMRLLVAYGKKARENVRM